MKLCTQNVRSSVPKWFDLIGWLAFVVWVLAATFVPSIPHGIGSLGVGIIVFGIALVRRAFGYSVSTFWLLIGAIFIAAGMGSASGVDFPFVSVALILCGILMFAHGRSKKH